MIKYEKGQVLFSASPRSDESIQLAQDYCRQNKFTQDNVKIVVTDLKTVDVVVHKSFNVIEPHDYLTGG